MKDYSPEVQQLFLEIMMQDAQTSWRFSVKVGVGMGTL